MATRTSQQIFSQIKKSFKDKTKEDSGAVLDLYSMSLSEVLENVYEEIEKNKTPHIWTALEGQKLDDTGTWVNLPRNPQENDTAYKYRLLNWMLVNEASNEHAITVKLLNPTHAANIEFVPMTHGCGTGTCYVIPRKYTEEVIAKSLEEARQKMTQIASPGLYIDYLVPELRSVSFEIYLETQGDINTMKENLTNQIRAYVNAIPPKQYLSVGHINKLGVNTSQVDFFSVMSLVINGTQVNKTKLLQEVESKFIFDSINWLEGRT